MLLLLILTGALGQQPIDAIPEQLVHRIIRYEEREGGTGTATFLSFFSPTLRRAIVRDTAGPDVGVLDYDPLCQCQDNGGLKMHVIRTKISHSAATVDLLSRNGADPGIKLRLVLRQYNRGWKVADVSTAEVPSLAAQLGLR